MSRRADGRKVSEWCGRFERFRRAGLSVARFCAAEQVSVPSFYQWRKKLAARQRERPPGPVLNLGGALHLGVRLGGRFFWRSGRGVLRGDILGWLRGARRPNGRDAVRRSPLSLRVTRPKQL